MNFVNTHSNLLKSFSFADVLIIEDRLFDNRDNEQGTLRKDPAIATFVEQLKAVTLRKSNL